MSHNSDNSLCDTYYNEFWWGVKTRPGHLVVARPYTIRDLGGKFRTLVSQLLTYSPKGSIGQPFGSGNYYREGEEGEKHLHIKRLPLRPN